MKSQSIDDELQSLALSIGDFIRYWGFRRVHGAVWTQIFLSPHPVSGTDLSRRLRFSKALISPALAELEAWRLIKKVPSANDKTVLFTAVDDVNSVIKHVLKKREAKMLAKISQQFGRVEKHKAAKETVGANRLAKLGTMISSAHLMLKLLLEEDQIVDLPNHFEE